MLALTGSSYMTAAVGDALIGIHAQRFHGTSMGEVLACFASSCVGSWEGQQTPN